MDLRIPGTFIYTNPSVLTKTPRNRCTHPYFTMGEAQNESNKHPNLSFFPNPFLLLLRLWGDSTSPLTPSHELEYLKAMWAPPSPSPRSADRLQVFFILSVLPWTPFLLCVRVLILLSLILCHLGYGASLPASPSVSTHSSPSSTL